MTATSHYCPSCPSWKRNVSGKSPIPLPPHDHLSNNTRSRYLFYYQRSLEEQGASSFQALQMEFSAGSRLESKGIMRRRSDEKLELDNFMVFPAKNTPGGRRPAIIALAPTVQNEGGDDCQQATSREHSQVDLALLDGSSLALPDNALLPNLTRPRQDENLYSEGNEVEEGFLSPVTSNIPSVIRVEKSIFVEVRRINNCQPGKSAAPSGKISLTSPLRPCAVWPFSLST